jgi:hypothetical protein
MHGYVAPSPDKRTFTCPHCGVYSAFHAAHLGQMRTAGGCTAIAGMTAQTCLSCIEEHGQSVDGTAGKILWLEDRMIYPLSNIAPPPNPDLPDDVKDDYMEAAPIAALSPRGAAALLRLCIDKLTTEVGAKGKSLDDRIGDPVKNGLDARIQKMLDSVRVIGNESVHPSQIDLRDDPELAASLFWLVNEIADEMISRPRRIEGIYDRIPEGKRDAIDKHDGKAPAIPD